MQKGAGPGGASSVEGQVEDVESEERKDFFFSFLFHRSIPVELKRRREANLLKKLVGRKKGGDGMDARSTSDDDFFPSFPFFLFGIFQN